jgi:hypothetical protein
MIKWSSAVAALAIAAACATAPADPMVHGARLVAQMREASGGAELDALTTYHSSGARVRDGKINGTYDTWGDYRTMAHTIRETFDGVTTMGGYDGKVGWSVGPDGKVRVESNPDKLGWTRLGAYVNTQGYLFPERFPAAFEFRGRREEDGRTYDVVKVTLEGASVDMWLDAKTHLLARLAGSNGPGAFTAHVLDYKTVDGVKVISRGLQTMTAGGVAHTETAEVETFRFEPVPPERLGPPK